MAKYFVADSIHEHTHAVHREGCEHINEVSCIYLGDFQTPEYAMYASKRLLFPNANGCLWCTPECYKSPDVGDLFDDDNELTPLHVPRRASARI